MFESFCYCCCCYSCSARHLQRTAVVGALANPVPEAPSQAHTHIRSTTRRQFKHRSNTHPQSAEQQLLFTRPRIAAIAPRATSATTPRGPRTTTPRAHSTAQHSTAQHNTALCTAPHSRSLIPHPPSIRNVGSSVAVAIAARHHRRAHGVQPAGGRVLTALATASARWLFVGHLELYEGPCVFPSRNLICLCGASQSSRTDAATETHTKAIPLNNITTDGRARDLLPELSPAAKSRSLSSLRASATADSPSETRASLVPPTTSALAALWQQQKAEAWLGS